MNWLVKVAAFKCLSTMPGGKRLYRFSQERFTKSLVPTRDRVGQKIGVGLQYLEWLAANGCVDRLLRGAHLDFGTGWHPTIPLLFYSLGCDRQFLFDVASWLDAPMIASTRETFLSIVEDPKWAHRSKVKRLPAAPDGTDWRAYLGSLGMSYHAPYFDAFPSVRESLDVVTSTQVLIYIPREPLVQCFKSLHQSLKSGGLLLATVYLKDLYADMDRSISKYNHLRYSPETWKRWFCSPLSSFNRFKARDYREALEAAGFRIRHFEVEGPTADDLKELEAIPVHPSFNRFTKEELGAKNLFFVAENA